jgi:hypothetical protein
MINQVIEIWNFFVKDTEHLQCFDLIKLYSAKYSSMKTPLQID